MFHSFLFSLEFSNDCRVLSFLFVCYEHVKRTVARFFLMLVCKGLKNFPMWDGPGCIFVERRVDSVWKYDALLSLPSVGLNLEKKNNTQISRSTKWPTFSFQHWRWFKTFLKQNFDYNLLTHKMWFSCMLFLKSSQFGPPALVKWMDLYTRKISCAVCCSSSSDLKVFQPITSLSGPKVAVNHWFISCNNPHQEAMTFCFIAPWKFTSFFQVWSQPSWHTAFRHFVELEDIVDDGGYWTTTDIQNRDCFIHHHWKISYHNAFTFCYSLLSLLSVVI